MCLTDAAWVYMQLSLSLSWRAGDSSSDYLSISNDESPLNSFLYISPKIQFWCLQNSYLWLHNLLTSDSILIVCSKQEMWTFYFHDSSCAHKIHAFHEFEESSSFSILILSKWELVHYVECPNPIRFMLFCSIYLCTSIYSS